jgi:hypothetical protein
MAAASQLESLRHDLQLAKSGVHANRLPEDDSVPSLQPLPPRGADLRSLSRRAAIDRLHHEIELLNRQIGSTEGRLSMHRAYLADLHLYEPDRTNKIGEVASDIAVQEQLVREWSVYRASLAEQLERLSEQVRAF